MSTSKVPKLPPTDDGEANSLRYAVNPAVALNALTDIYQHVQQYQVQLRQLVHRIQRIYAEGPVVSGWLASEASLHAAVNYSSRVTQREFSSESLTSPSHPSPQGEPMDIALFRHGDADDLMDYLSALESAMLGQGPSPDQFANGQTSIQGQADHLHGGSSQYYLCQLDSCGQIHAEQCPPEQVPVLSMAIARYRRLNQLTKQKQAIETRLQAIVDVLGDAQRLLAE